MLAFSIDLVDNRFIIRLTERRMPAIPQGHTIQDLIDSGMNRVTEIEIIKIKDNEDELAEQVLGMVLEWAKSKKAISDDTELTVM